MGILRGVKEDDLEPLLESVISSGLETLEITMNTPRAAGLISKALKVAGDRITLGAGTVLSKSDLEEALDAGASFIVLPTCEKELVELCLEKKIPVFPGAFTPQEVFDAWKMAPSMVKVFPSSMFGPKYIKELKGPFDRIKLMAVGGVRPENIQEYFSCGADAVAFGSSVFKKEYLESKDFSSIRELVGKYVQSVRKAQEK